MRKALGLGHDNFYLYGHSWGGLLGIEYALKYPQHLKGLVVSNMMASSPAYNEYARKVLMPADGPDRACRSAAARGRRAGRRIRATWNC